LSIKSDLLKQIDKKASQYKRQKDYAAGRISYKTIVADFIKAVENARIEAKNGPDFYCQVSALQAKFTQRLQQIDPDILFEILWLKEEQAEEWKDLRVEGIQIKWGSKWLRSNPDVDPEITLKIEHLWMEGL
jgi:hypothetical protein